MSFCLALLLSRRNRVFVCAIRVDWLEPYQWYYCLVGFRTIGISAAAAVTSLIAGITWLRRMRSSVTACLVLFLVCQICYSKPLNSKQRESNPSKVPSAKLTNEEVIRRQKEDKLLFPSYPTSITPFPVRMDPYNSNETVSRGRFKLIGGIPDSSPSATRKKIPLQEFKRKLQCSPTEPALDEYYGTLSLMLLSPPTRETVELIAAWAETKCVTQGSDWTACRRVLKQFRDEKQFPKAFGMLSLFEWRFQLLRIINSEIYYDWPWGIERVPKFNGITSMFQTLAMTVNSISDLGDSVFLFGAEQPVLPWTFPFPHICMAGSYAEFDHSTNTVLWPWEQEFNKELELNEHIVRDKFGDFSDKSIRELTNTIPWDQKMETRAAFYASYDNSRWVIMEQAARHPDLFDFSSNDFYALFCWTPDCTVQFWVPPSFGGLSRDRIEGHPAHAGMSLLNYSHNPTQRYYPGQYKYVVVPLGMAGRSTSSRLLNLLTYCECVVLLITAHLQYHITARLVPWVHYVPLSASGADLPAKVRWLQQHDDLARQIAENGHNFGKSYLRLEDYLCYAATTMEALATVMANTTALEPFNPIKMF